MTGGERFELFVPAELLEAFVRLTGDRSPIHVDAEFARRTRFRDRIVHGMLPVLCVVGRALRAHPTGRRLGRLDCRFSGPCFVGDRLQCAVEWAGEADAPSISFEIRRADGAEVTTGSARFDLPGAGGAVAPQLPMSTVELAAHTIDGLSVGHRESFEVRPAGDAIAALLAQAFGAVLPPGEAGFDPNLAAAVATSTLVGMRLPGRYATFMDCTVKFDRALSPSEPAALAGEIVKMLPAGGRMSLALEVSQHGQRVGDGKASVMVGQEGPEGIRCEEIRRSLLPLGLEGKVALVTGASRGIGEATAKMLAMLGCRVAVHFFRGERAAAAVVDDIRGQGGVAEAVRCDLSSAGGPERMFEEIAARLGPVDILVNNAVGTFAPKPFDDVRRADFLEELEVSLFGVHECVRLALPSMRERRWGRIVNLGTIAVDVPVASQARYIAAKSALVGYTRSLAIEAAADGVCVNLVVPSMTDTTLLAGLPRSLVDRLASESPSGRLLQPIDVARAIAFLASDWGGTISGQRLVLNQGEAPFL